jgi:hypothetical protein
MEENGVSLMTMKITILRFEIRRVVITTAKWRNRNHIETSSIRTDVSVTRIMIVAKAKDIL